VALLFAGLLISLPALAYFGLHIWIAVFSNPNYASEVFDGVVRYAGVLASKKWNSIGDEAEACTYAVVDLGLDPEAEPPRGEASADWRFVYAGDWLPTPDGTLSADNRNPVGVCKGEWTEETAARVTGALSRPGSWYWRDAEGDAVFIYSVPELIAARIRWGD
jgi:hypothetical protein